ncbi:MAG: asparagine synthase (glutamine-hydrolyzing) [Desulfobacteraceae bacterium IS3]|nr:MAG: asparagine synthase (glutamine-hydrolyzing) [Desulfobacteraceae bacterium IS3]
MCGITGIFNIAEGPRIEKELIEAMANTLAHRGPDDSGFYSDDGLGFGFRRLSIIDLTSGNQPIYNEDRSVVVVCNGEIFNYKELRHLLESKGHRFYTHCDVEVLVHLYEEYGADFLNKLNGQFAFAIYDRKSRNLLLARDHVGIAPLFYTVADNIFIFGSEIKAILKHPLVKREVDLTALDQIFSFPGIVSPRTMFRNISSLKPGHFLLIRDGKIEVKAYWDLDYPHESEIENEKPESYYIEKLDELLTRSVQYRLQADVPVGFYLSGGMDSSLTATIIRKLHSDKRHSFSIGFRQADIDERKYQQLMANAVGSVHHDVVFDWHDISNRLKQVIYHAETPLKESYDTCSLTLSELVRNNGIKVVLTGEGSDELFAGYVGYRFDMQRSEFGEDTHSIEMMMEREIREKLWGDPDFFYERNQYEFRETKQAIYSERVNETFREFNSMEQELLDRSKLAGRHPIHKRSYIDFKLRIADHLLADHGDRVAYANSVEARYPFLDIEFIDFVKTIPPSLMIKGPVEKYILKRLSEKYLPEQIINREKFAFVAPGSPYLIRQNIEWINEFLSYNTIKKQGYFNPDTVERLKKMYRGDNFNVNQTYENDLLMIVLTFGIFLELFKMPDR